MPLVNLTPPSLLDRLRHAPPDDPSWKRLEEMYSPLIASWVARVADVRDEADDLVQEVLLALVRGLPAFERRRDGAFRAWLRHITVNRLRAFWKARRKRPLAGMGDETERLLAQLEDAGSSLARQWDREHDMYVLERLLAAAQRDVEPETWEAFTRYALRGRPAAAVAQELGVSENAVVLAKHRVLKRLRAEAADLID